MFFSPKKRFVLCGREVMRQGEFKDWVKRGLHRGCGLSVLRTGEGGRIAYVFAVQGVMVVFCQIGFVLHK